ncbi:uncharacterized protein LOC126597351 isoform X2 [Malus sylvestris]|uniref:uncharacterized protein LOC126597351 isoform X1 n=1 Tax=Malus sylvestris TaxID=3752 RepID=UPI0021ACAA29|nr:uncharacterized protein LOC126597351 isoform X1 [Malus sylvestris]XP_050120096.1 uncharacterized protein LOC126597351 isoform X2 [Malus sylvestris]
MPCRHIRRGRGACCLIFSHTRDVSVATRRDSPTLKAACSLQGLGAFVFHVKCRRFVALDSHCNGGTGASASFFFFAPTQGLVAVAAVLRSCPESLHLQPTTTPSQPPNHRRNVSLGARKPRSWFGPNGQYIRELPCPSCRGRGYTPCSDCGIERSRSDCSQCVGKGIMTCRQCSGECVIWEESIDERPWEKARSISPLRVKEDDEVDNLDVKLVRRKSKRVYQSPPPEVGLKISRSLKSLNAKTGLFSKRMKIIHRDPMLHAQRVAAIKKAKGTAAARKHTSEALKAFFSDPENRRKGSISMTGKDKIVQGQSKYLRREFAKQEKACSGKRRCWFSAGRNTPTGDISRRASSSTSSDSERSRRCWC